ncbi:hypothetical protein MHU86_26009 [Fragilaria crotonensis]|nr:hypothetical protein MHU86_26009 [Fragilaria crotonensis]
MNHAGRSKKTYGGACGIFIKKRQRVLTVATSCRTATSMRTVTPSPTALLVGWDDVKCRPIFEIASPSPTPISDEDNDDQHDSPISEQIQNKWNGEPTRKRQKAYGTQKRDNFFPEAPKLTGVSAKVTGHKALPVRSSPDAQATKKCSTFASPPIVEESICDALDSSRKQVATRSEPCNLPLTTAVVVPTSVTDGMVLKKRRRSNKPKVEISTTELDFVEDTKQPTSTTSVTAAKAFFDRLDSVELQLDASQTPLVHTKRCGRTQKEVDLRDGNLQREYEIYSVASRQSGVTPIPLVEYAQNRSDIFRRFEMFDGFLDG